MSFAGHVFDMIRRNKEDRDRLNQRRERTNENRKKNLEKMTSYDLSNITTEDLELIQRQTEERNREHQSKTLQMSYLILLLVFVLALVSLVIFKFVVN